MNAHQQLILWTSLIALAGTSSYIGCDMGKRWATTDARKEARQEAHEYYRVVLERDYQPIPRRTEPAPVIAPAQFAVFDVGFPEKLPMPPIALCNCWFVVSITDGTTKQQLTDPLMFWFIDSRNDPAVAKLVGNNRLLRRIGREVLDPVPFTYTGSTVTVKLRDRLETWQYHVDAKENLWLTASTPDGGKTVVRCDMKLR